MPRPSKKTERIDEILQAFQRCILQYGLAGSSLELIATEAGMQRSLVRHFAGTRNKLIGLLASSIIEETDEQWRQFKEALPRRGAIGWLLEGLFSPQRDTNDKQIILSTLTHESGNNPALRAMLEGWIEQFLGDLKEILKQEYPNASPEDLSAVSFGVCSLYINLDSMATPLELEHKFRADAFRAAEQLISTLKNNSVLGV